MLHHPGRYILRVTDWAVAAWLRVSATPSALAAIPSQVVWAGAVSRILSNRLLDDPVFNLVICETRLSESQQREECQYCEYGLSHF